MRTLEPSVKWIRVLIIGTPFSEGLIVGLVGLKKVVQIFQISRIHYFDQVGLNDLVETKLFNNEKNVPIYTGEFFFPHSEIQDTSFTFQNV